MRLHTKFQTPRIILSGTIRVPVVRVGQFGLPFVKYPQSDADACYNLESNSELV